MEEIEAILAKYDQDYRLQLLACSEEADRLVLVLFRRRCRNLERYYSLNERGKKSDRILY